MKPVDPTRTGTGLSGLELDLEGTDGGLAQLCSQEQFGRQLTINLELVRSRGIRLFN